MWQDIEQHKLSVEIMASFTAQEMQAVAVVGGFQFMPRIRQAGPPRGFRSQRWPSTYEALRCGYFSGGIGRTYFGLIKNILVGQCRYAWRQVPSGASQVERRFLWDPLFSRGTNRAWCYACAAATGKSALRFILGMGSGVMGGFSDGEPRANRT